MAVALVGMVGGAAQAGPGVADPDWVELARAVLPVDDGWASEGVGTTGGAAAAVENIYVVRTWQEFRDALGGSDAAAQTQPRIVLVDGRIDAFGFNDETSALPTCADIASAVTVVDGPGDPGRPFSMDEYVAHYDPLVWGLGEPTGPLEVARAQAEDALTAQVRQRVGSNVTILGLGDNAELVGANLWVDGVSNVILRNLKISDSYDCFPQWDPTDGDTGNWNSLYDSISVMGSTNVWADHLTLDDGDHPRQQIPLVFGRPFEVHDGLLDITNSSDLVTVSYTVFDNHDKTNLVGSSNSRKADIGTLRTTWHHNHWNDVGQRAPRVRFGDVDVFNNLYTLSTTDGFDYFWGAGVESSIYAEKNAFSVPADFDSARILHNWGGTQVVALDSLVNGASVDVVAAYNATAEPAAQLAATARWTPVHRAQVDPVENVQAIVLAEAGAGRLAPAVKPDPGPTPTTAPSDPVAVQSAPADAVGTGSAGSPGELAATGSQSVSSILLAGAFLATGMLANLMQRRRASQLRTRAAGVCQD